MEEIQSRAPQFAIAAGLKPQMAHTVRQTAPTGVSGFDRWMNEN